MILTTNAMLMFKYGIVEQLIMIISITDNLEVRARVISKLVSMYNSLIKAISEAIFEKVKRSGEFLNERAAASTFPVFEICLIDTSCHTHPHTYSADIRLICLLVVNTILK